MISIVHPTFAFAEIAIKGFNYYCTSRTEHLTLRIRQEIIHFKYYTDSWITVKWCQFLPLLTWAELNQLPKNWYYSYLHQLKIWHTEILPSFCLVTELC